MWYPAYAMQQATTEPGIGAAVALACILAVAIGGGWLVRRRKR